MSHSNDDNWIIQDTILWIVFTQTLRSFSSWKRVSVYPIRNTCVCSVPHQSLQPRLFDCFIMILPFSSLGRIISHASPRMGKQSAQMVGVVLEHKIWWAICQGVIFFVYLITLNIYIYITCLFRHFWQSIKKQYIKFDTKNTAIKTRIHNQDKT